MNAERQLHLYALLGLAMLVHAFLFSFFSVRDQFVDSQRYLEMSEYFIAEGQLEHFTQFFYAIPIALLAMFHAMVDDGLLAFVLFQSALSILAAVALYRSAATVFNNSRAGLVAAAIFLLWFDCLQWNTAVMTESLASSLTCFIIYLVVVFDGRITHFFLLVLGLVAILMTRPTGVVVIVAAVVFLLSRYDRRLKQHPLVKGLSYLSLTVGFVIGACMMLNEWDFTDQYVKGNLVTYMDVIEGQDLYDPALRLDTKNITWPDPERPPAEKIVLFVISNPFHFVKAAVLKVFYLVTFYRPYFSDVHNLYTAVWLSIVYVFFFLGLRQIGDKPVKHFVLAVIIANCLLVALSAADWDNRFYMPMQPCIVLLAGGGGGAVWNMVTKFSSGRSTQSGSGRQ